MKSLAVLIPVKSREAKSRLSGVLSSSERREFTRLLLSGVLGAFRVAGLLPACHVVSPDEEVLELAARLGARQVREPGDEGVNSAVMTGVRAAGRPDNVLVVPSDLPMIRASDIRHLLGMKSAGLEVVVTPSRGFDGTNALAFSGASPLGLSFDNNSFWNHLASAAGHGLSLGVCSERGLMFDVDSPDDFTTLARTRVNSPSAAFARRMLR